MLLLSVNVFSTKVLILGRYFYVPNWRRDRHIVFRAGLQCQGSTHLHFSVSIGPAPGIEPATSAM